jgi:transforming growth factor-beta-induced protein
MNRNGLLLCSLLIGAAPLTASACGDKNIVQTAMAAGSFETLVKALKAADLVSTLEGDGPFTVFAPSDAAFAALPKGALEDLLRNPDSLRAVLLLHVVPGKVSSAEVAKLTSVKTALGQTLPIATKHDVSIGSAKAVKADIATSNGIIHVIDSVLLPANDIVEVARASGQFKTLLTALDAAGLTDVLRGEGPFTVFAPTDKAFEKLPAGTLKALLADKAKLKSVLTYHVVPGRVMAADVAKLKSAKTVQGGELTIEAGGSVKVNNANVIKTDIGTTNGVIHVIDTVLIPS